MAGPLYLIPTGPNRQIWNSSWMPLAVLAMAFSTWATGMPIPGPLNLGTDQFSGKSSTPLPLHAFSGGIRKEAPLPLRQPSSSGHLGFWHFPGTLIMHLVRSIFFSTATNHYTVLVTHIVGTNNSVADSLLRLQISRLHRLTPTAELHPTPASAVTLWHTA